MKMLTRSQCREALGEMPERTFARWCAKGLPVKGDGEKARYPWPEVFRWLCEQIERRGREGAESGGATKDAEMRLQVAKAEMAELDLAERRGELMTLDQYNEAVAGAFGRVRAQLLTWPGKMATEAAAVSKPSLAQKLIQRYVGEIMDELYQAKDVPEQEDAA